MKQLGVLLLPLDGMLVHHRVPSMKQLGVLLLPPGWDGSPLQGTQHVATATITTPPGWNASLLVHHKVPSMKQLGVLLFPPGWDLSPSQSYPPLPSSISVFLTVASTRFYIYLGEERQYGHNTTAERTRTTDLLVEILKFGRAKH